MLNNHTTISKAEFDADDALLRMTTAERDEAIAKLHEPTHCELCSRKLTDGDCIPCQVSFTTPF